VAGQVQWGLSAWPFAASLLVSPLLAGLVTVPIYLYDRYRAPRMALWTWILSAAMVTISAWASGALFTWIVGSGLRDKGSAVQLGAVAAAMPAYLAVEVVLFFVITRLNPEEETAFQRARLSSGDFYFTEVAVLATGASAAVVCRYWLGFVVIMIPVVMVLQRAWLYVPLKRKALQDPRTRLLNYPAWRQAAQTAVRRTLARNQGYSVVFADLDHFKRVNDRYGHAVGDQVLLCVADAICLVTRPDDLVGRYGGEEFCLLLPGADLTNGTDVAERLRGAVAALRFSDPELKVTASLGVAVQGSRDAQGTDENIDDLVLRADKAMYAAKAAGRNRVHVWAPDE
jgi:diguanylate cyclase (GGDEF)-like protein